MAPAIIKMEHETFILFHMLKELYKDHRSKLFHLSKTIGKTYIIYNTDLDKTAYSYASIQTTA